MYSCGTLRGCAFASYSTWCSQFSTGGEVRRCSWLRSPGRMRGTPAGSGAWGGDGGAAGADQGGSHDEMPEQQGGLPQMAALGLTEEERGVAGRGDRRRDADCGEHVVEARRVAQPRTVVEQTDHQPRRAHGAEGAEGEGAEEEPGPGVRLGDEV